MHAPNPKVVAEALDLFRDELLEDDRTSFTFAEAEKLAGELGFSVASVVIQGLKARGFTMVERQPDRQVRGFRSNNHNRYCDPTNKTHGGSGWEQITGFAGQNG